MTTVNPAGTALNMRERWRSRHPWVALTNRWGETFECDEELAPLIALLNTVPGVQTMESCQGDADRDFAGFSMSHHLASLEREPYELGINELAVWYCQLLDGHSLLHECSMWMTIISDACASFTFPRTRIPDIVTYIEARDKDPQDIARGVFIDRPGSFFDVRLVRYDSYSGLFSYAGMR